MPHALPLFMHTNPKLEAQMVEEAGLTAEPLAVPSVAKPDVADKTIEAAQLVEKEKTLQPKTPSPGAGALPAAPSKQDLDRSEGEGMTAPPSSP